MALPGTHRLVLALLTALLVAQVSLYQTLRSAVQRVAAVLTVCCTRSACRRWSPGCVLDYGQDVGMRTVE